MDPLFSLVLIFLFVSFWTLAAAKKLRHLAWFETVLRDYAILPKPFVKPMSLLIPTGEVGIVIMLIVLPKFGALLSVGVLGFYALILAFNGLRGNKIEDCGCTWGGVIRDETSSTSYKAYVLRNIGLACLISLVFLGAPVRTLTFWDWGNAALMSIFVAVAVFVIPVIISNHKSLKVFRHG